MVLSRKMQKKELNSQSENGLSNSFPIVQQHYIEKMKRGENINYFEILKDDIRNLRPITNAQLNYIKTLNRDNLFEIIEISNDVIKILISYMNDTK